MATRLQGSLLLPVSSLFVCQALLRGFQNVEHLLHTSLAPTLWMRIDKMSDTRSRSLPATQAQPSICQSNERGNLHRSSGTLHAGHPSQAPYRANDIGYH